MAKRFVRDLVLALSVLLIAAVLVYIDLDFTEPVRDYLTFIVSTDFSFQSVFNRVEFLQKIKGWDVGTLFEAWPQVSPGR